MFSKTLRLAAFPCEHDTKLYECPKWFPGLGRWQFMVSLLFFLNGLDVLRHVDKMLLKGSTHSDELHLKQAPRKKSNVELDLHKESWQRLWDGSVRRFDEEVYRIILQELTMIDL
eukprot:946518-Amphidinium_carterae.1